MEPISQVLTEALDKMGDLSGATVTLINDAGEFTGNEKAAQLLEVFNTPARGNAPRYVTIVTRYLGQDFNEAIRVAGVPPGYVGYEVQRGILRERFAKVNSQPFNHKVFPVIAELMVEETHLSGALRDGMRAVVAENMSQGRFNPDSGIGSLRAFVDGFLNREMTPEWQEYLVDNASVNKVAHAMRKGLKSGGIVPATARFAPKRTT